MKWSAQAILRAGAFVVLMALMLAVPLLQLSRGSDRFDWRMFSQARPLPSFTVVDAVGTETAIVPAEFTAALRGDIPFEAVLPPHLCSVVAGTVMVEIVTQGPAEIYRCP